MITSYIGKKRELYLEVLKKKLKSSRFEHTLRTEKKALELAKRFSVDLSKAADGGASARYIKKYI